MDELQLYGKDGLFHNVVNKSAVFAGRYGVLPKGGGDLNQNNILAGIEFPKAKYPGVFCLPPVSQLPATVQQAQWECFTFRLFFLCTTHNTGDNQIKSPDPSTNTSLHTVPMDWSDMKTLALNFMNALEKLQMKIIKEFRLKQNEPWRIVRLSNVQNDNLSGVMLQFLGEIATPCEFNDIPYDTETLNEIIAGMAPPHQTHFH
jgi:hypothetical protein